jgi:flagellar hook-associated protein 3 FlgL
MSVSSVSTSTVSSILQNTVSRLQTQLTTTSTEASTGLLADIGLTLGENSGQDITLHQQMSDLNAISSSNQLVTAQLDTAYNALTNLQSSTESMVSQLVTGQSTTPGTSGAAALQQAASGALSSFTSTMNSESGGQYVFGGINTGVAPVASYSQTPASAAQTAVDNAFQATFGFATTSPSVSTITATQMTNFLSTQFAAQFTGSNWTSNWSSASSTAQSNRIGVNETVPTSISANQSAFQDTAQALVMVSEFGGLNLNASAYSALMTSASSVMNSANNGLIGAAATVGNMQNQVTNANSAISLQQNTLNTQINNKEAVNSYQVATEVSNISTQLQTAYSLTSQIHKLSLVNFL